MKRTLIVVGAVVALLGLGVLGYFFLFKQAPTLTVSPGSLLPGSGDATGSSSQGSTAQELGVPVTGAGTKVAPRLIRISDVPVVFGAGIVNIAGTIASSSAVGSTTAYATDPDVSITYLEQESGNVFDFREHARTLTRVSNKTLPGIHSAVWTPDASLAFVRFLDHTGGAEDISTYALPRTGDGGYTLERGISGIAATGSSTLLTVHSTTNGTVATISSFLGTGVRTFFTSPISRLSVSSGGGITIASTKAAASLGGYAFLVDAKSGSFTRVLGPLKGLTTLVSPTGKSVLYSYLDGKSLALAVFDMKTNTAIRLPLGTLTEKCTWSSDGASLFCAVPVTLSGTFPDDWYQGATRTTDRLWRIDMGSRVATQIVDPSTVGAGAIDAVNLAIDKQSDVLIFTNRIDGTLWSYDL